MRNGLQATGRMQHLETLKTSRDKTLGLYDGESILGLPVIRI